MFQNIGNDERKVFRSNDRLTVAKFGDTLRYLLHLLRSKLKTKFLKVHLDICLARCLAKRILTLSAETLRHKFVAIELVLVVAVSMNACYLSKDILTNDWLIRCYDNTRIAFHHATDIIEHVFLY